MKTIFASRFSTPIFRSLVSNAKLEREVRLALEGVREPFTSRGLLSAGLLLVGLFLFSFCDCLAFIEVSLSLTQGISVDEGKRVAVDLDLLVPGYPAKIEVIISRCLVLFKKSEMWTKRLTYLCCVLMSVRAGDWCV